MEIDLQAYKTNLWLSKRQVGWEGIIYKFGIKMYILLYIKQITNKDLLYSREYSISWGVLTNSCEKKRSKKQRRKGKM